MEIGRRRIAEQAALRMLVDERNHGLGDFSDRLVKLGLTRVPSHEPGHERVELKSVGVGHVPSP